MLAEGYFLATVSTTISTARPVTIATATRGLRPVSLASRLLIQWAVRVHAAAEAVTKTRASEITVPSIVNLFSQCLEI
jgi:hypothetical protein